MSQEITTAMITTYRDGFEHLAQQVLSKLRPKVRITSEPGERVNDQQIGAVKARERFGRHEDTQYIDVPHRRRWVFPRTFDLADLLDLPDAFKIVNDPSGEYAQAFVMAMNREYDAEIAAAAIRDATVGKNGNETAALPAGQKIPEGGTGFTLDKLAQAMRILRANNAAEGPGAMCVAWTSFQEEEFLKTNEVKSIDYNTQKVLVKGTLEGEDMFYGFNFVNVEDWRSDEVDNSLYRILPKAGDTRTCIAWTQSGMWLNIHEDPSVKIEQLASKKYSWQVFTWCQFGATRVQEKKVVQIDVAEAGTP